MNNGNPETSTQIATHDVETRVDPADLAMLGARPDLAALYQRFCQLSMG